MIFQTQSHKPAEKNVACRSTKEDQTSPYIMNSKREDRKAHHWSNSAIVSVCGCNNSNSRSNNAKWNFTKTEKLVKKCVAFKMLFLSLQLEDSMINWLFSSSSCWKTQRSQSETESNNRNDTQNTCKRNRKAEIDHQTSQNDI